MATSTSFCIRVVLLFLMTIASPISSAAETSVDGGKLLFEEYGCGNCHGRDGKTGSALAVPALAGRNADELFIKSKRYIDGEQNAAWKGCGETPNYKDLRAISQYISSLSQK